MCSPGDALDPCVPDDVLWIVNSEKPEVKIACVESSRRQHACASDSDIQLPWLRQYRRVGPNFRTCFGSRTTGFFGCSHEWGFYFGPNVNRAGGSRHGNWCLLPGFVRVAPSKRSGDDAEQSGNDFQTQFLRREAL